MAEDKGKEEEKFDFTAEGEVLDYISLQQAVLLSRRQARESDERYKERLGWEEIVWAELRSEVVGEDYYRIVLQFRRPARGILEEQTGEEEFLFDLTGVLQDRQVLLWPESLSAGQGEVDTTAMPQLEVSALQPAELPSIAEALTSPPDFPHAEPTERRSEASPNGEEGGAADTAEVELGTSTISPPSIKPAPSIRSDDRPLRTSSPIRRATVTSRVRQIAGILLGLWSAVLLMGGTIEISEGQLPGGLLILAGCVATIVGAGLLWPQTKLRFGRLGSRWGIIGLVVGGFVAFVVGVALTAE